MQSDPRASKRRAAPGLAFGAAACFFIAAAIDEFGANTRTVAFLGLYAVALVWLIIGFVWLKKFGR